MDIVIGSRKGITEEEVFSTLGDCGEPNVFINDPKEGTSKNLFWRDLWENWPHWSEVPEFIKSQGWDMKKELAFSSDAFYNGGWYNPNIGAVYSTSQGRHYNGVIHGRWWKKGEDHQAEELNPLEVFGEEGFQEVERMLDAGLTVRFWMGRSASNVLPARRQGGNGSGFVQAQVILKAQAEGEMFALKSSLFPGEGWITESDKALAEAFVRGHLEECPKES